MHKARVVQKLNLLPVEERLAAMEGAGFNTFLLQNRDVFLDMLTDSGTNAMSNHPFKGNIDIDKLKAQIEKTGRERVPYVRMEAGTNLIGGQPFSIANMREVREVCDANDLMVVLDISLIAENVCFIKTREEEFKDADIKTIIRAMCDLADIIYFSGRKVLRFFVGRLKPNSDWTQKLVAKFREDFPDGV